MHHIRRIEVEGFWDTHKVGVDLNPDVTFFIGENGTGKTTLINLIAAALTADFATLEKLSFKKLTIFLNPDESGKKPSIIVSKTMKKERPIELLEYKIREDEGGAETKYSLDETQERAYMRRELSARYMSEYYRHFATGLTAALGNLVKVDWLSVHRTPNTERTREERTYESTVDKKLESLSNDLVRYFASLSKQKDEKVRAFQEFLFVSLLEQPTDNQLFELKNETRLEEEKQSMTAIFKELRVSRGDVARLIESFYGRAKEISKVKHQGFGASDLSILVSLRRIDAIVDEWKAYKRDIDKIFELRNKYIDLANGLFQRKQLVLNESDELVFVTRSNKRLTPQMLSSGEKQLLILLSEALLQRRAPSIFIADEPELSLHVRWQEKLVPNLRDLNSNSQIIAATHSPDIVGPLSDRTIDMETIIP
jgi:predicted ATPase